MTWERENVLPYSCWRPHSSVLPKNENKALVCIEEQGKGIMAPPFLRSLPLSVMTEGE